MPDNHRKSIEIMEEKIKEAEAKEASCDQELDSFVQKTRETLDERDELRELIKCLRRSMICLQDEAGIFISDYMRFNPKDINKQKGGEMHEVYTCICGDQRWSIQGAKIECDKCSKKYILMWDVGIDGQMESPKEFNERIKKEA